MQIKKYYKKGFSIIETLIYTSLLSLLSVITITSIVLLNQSLQSIVLGRIVDDAAQEVMEKIIREIRFADNVDLVNSTLSVNPSILSLDSTDTIGTPVDVEFSISSSTLQFKRDGVLIGPLTPNQVTIDELIFDHIATPVSEAVKVSLVLEARKGAVHIEETFNTTVVLRGSY